MKAKRDLMSKLDRAQLYTVIEICCLLAGFIGTLILQSVWPALIGLASCWGVSRIVSAPLTDDIEADVQSEWNDD